MAGDRENHGNAMTLTEAVNEIRRLQAKVKPWAKKKLTKKTITMRTRSMILNP
jgi:hypothetical protein